MATPKLVVRALYAYDEDEVSKLTGLACQDLSLTVQSDAMEADINVILDRFGITGQLPQKVRAPTYQDFGDQIFDFRSAVEAVAMAEDAFMSMPAKVRARFENDPQKFVEFCSFDVSEGDKFSYSPGRRKELEELGLVLPVPPSEPEKVMKVEVVNPSLEGTPAKPA